MMKLGQQGDVARRHQLSGIVEPGRVGERRLGEADASASTAMRLANWSSVPPRPSARQIAASLADWMIMPCRDRRPSPPC